MDKDIDTLQLLGQKYVSLHSILNERSLRLWCASEARALGHGGIIKVHKATGVSRPTIIKGLKELDNPSNLSKDQIRLKGGGRKKLIDKDPSLLMALDKLISPATRGDPESALRWSSKSTSKLADELCEQGYNITQRTVHRLLIAQKYSMKSNRKTNEGAKENPDRDQQFKFINQKTIELQNRGCPALSVDTKKKENIGEFKNNGKEWSRRGEHTEVNCLIPGRNGVYYEDTKVWREGLWGSYYTSAPGQRRKCVERYNYVKRA
jgi:hypothetical protein